jgi:hypothetical protein
MQKALTVSEAKPKLGRLLDKAAKGEAVYLLRKKRLYRIEPMMDYEPIPDRPVGHFAVEEHDPMIGLANAAPAAFPPQT